MDDFKKFMHRASEMKIRIVIDLVVNHTSHEHPWFQEARKDPNSKYRGYYVWSDEKIAFNEEHLMLAGEENTMWTYDQAARQYYLHRFYSEQPDLNITNPEVRREILHIMRHWLDLGVSGFRIDAAEILIEPYGINGHEHKDLTFFLDELRTFAESINPEAVLIAESNVNPPDMGVYIKEGKRMNMLFNFFVNQHMFYSMATKKVESIANAIEVLPSLHGSEQWLNFLRHHDELSLKLLNDQQREQVYQAFAPDPNMRIFARGVRRRLAPLLHYDRARLELAYSLLFSMPGTPLLRYGDEIEMDDDLSLPGRQSVRTPMEWEKAKKQTDDANSLLNWLKRLVQCRKEFNMIGNTEPKITRAEKNLLVHCFEDCNRSIWFVHNFSDLHCQFELDAIKSASILLKGNAEVDTIKANIQLKPYGYIWFTKA